MNDVRLRTVFDDLQRAVAALDVWQTNHESRCSGLRAESAGPLTTFVDESLPRHALRAKVTTDAEGAVPAESVVRAEAHDGPERGGSYRTLTCDYPLRPLGTTDPADPLRRERYFGQV
ncbi:hypothetical protein VSH64_41630 [Amycolatopsis rhabdoformis]|uniref:Uncharacterized protein n=1 Tax=Amycolatopsis rhabdoformis TaxID=1448059 RepID=A0ABZ1I6T5_9PSEU|nr:hypothetical protein [Amycolatopsis rhabdoformis]WSE29243.1 hypothetical protein VSH64_41630 [Amycolatopsis rhabdoformis]